MHLVLYKHMQFEMQTEAKYIKIQYTLIITVEVVKCRIVKH